MCMLMCTEAHNIHDSHLVTNSPLIMCLMLCVVVVRILLTATSFRETPDILCGQSSYVCGISLDIRLDCCCQEIFVVFVVEFKLQEN